MDFLRISYAYHFMTKLLYDNYFCLDVLLIHLRPKLTPALQPAQQYQSQKKKIHPIATKKHPFNEPSLYFRTRFYGVVVDLYSQGNNLLNLEKDYY